MAEESVVGDYDDPLHGACTRTIVDVGSKLFIVGIYVRSELAPEDRALHTGQSWATEMQWDGSNSRYNVSFTGKLNGHNAFLPHTPLTAVSNGNTLTWSDGNTWTRTLPSPPAGTTTRRRLSY